MQNHRIKQAATKEVKSYQSLHNSSRLSILMYKKTNQYGVLIKQANGVLCAPNFELDNSCYRTFQGNEMDVIDWVNLDEATRRYTHLVLADINRVSLGNKQDGPGEPQRHVALKLVHG